MAGGKETPRQKLIGIMYLILLALLALQVSSAIMEKFKFLDDSLQYANEESKKNAERSIKNIEKLVEDNGKKASDIAILTKATMVHQATEKIVATINDLRGALITKTGGFEVEGDKTSMFKGAKAETEVEDLMIGVKGLTPGKAYDLKKSINDYCSELEKITGEKFPPLALDGKEDKRITEKQQKDKDFAELNFAQTPMVASMAVLSNLQSQILKYDNEALRKLGGDVGGDQIKFDAIKASYNAESRVVAAGTKYKAQLFLAASSTTLKPVISFEGRPVPVKDGVGEVEFTATGGAYDKDGNAKKSFTYKITIKNKGKDTTFTAKGEYVVAKPVIQVQAAAVSALYRNCGNEINVQVPALGSVYQPSFSGSTGGEFINGASKGAVTIVPTGSSVTLKVSSGGNFIGDQVFKVKGIPLPQIVCLAGALPVNEKQGMSAPGPRSLILNAKPDEAFGTFLPKDAKYDVKQYEVLLVRGKRPVQTKMGSGRVCDLSSFAAVANAGDRIVIDVKKVSRTNFKGQVEDVPGISKIINIPLN
jgi:gliding motility-associated protein GldM